MNFEIHWTSFCVTIANLFQYLRKKCWLDNYLPLSLHILDKLSQFVTIDKLLVPRNGDWQIHRNMINNISELFLSRTKNDNLKNGISSIEYFRSIISVLRKWLKEKLIIHNTNFNYQKYRYIVMLNIKHHKICSYVLLP